MPAGKRQPKAPKGFNARWPAALLGVLLRPAAKPSADKLNRVLTVQPQTGNETMHQPKQLRAGNETARHFWLYLYKTTP